MSTVEVKVPNIGDFKDVEVIELMVKPGDTIKVDQSLVTVESDKASMEIPSTHAGVVKELKVKVGDKVNEGSLLLTVGRSRRWRWRRSGRGRLHRPPQPAPAVRRPRSTPDRFLRARARRRRRRRPHRRRTRPATAARSTSNAR